MSRSDEFDAFYQESRDRLLHHVYAYTGVTEEAQRSLSDAYVSAAQRWRRVAARPDRDGWVRTRAFAAASHARNRSREPWYVSARSTADQHRRLLAALGALDPADRHLFIARKLAGLDLPDAAREAGIDGAAAQASLDRSTGALEDAGVDTSPPELDALLDSLRGDLRHEPADRSSRLRREGNRRRHSYQLLTAVVVAAVAVGGVAYANRDTAPGPSTPVATPETSNSPTTSTPPAPEAGVADLATIAAVGTLDPALKWRLDSTSADLGVSRPPDPCLTTLPDSATAAHYWVRQFSTGRPAAATTTAMTATQTLEVATSRSNAQAAYSAQVADFAGCASPGHRLVEVRKISGVSDLASVVQLQYVDSSGLHDEIVGVARTGVGVSTWVVHEPQGDVARSRPVVRLLASSVASVCRVSAGACPAQPYRATVVLPPADASAPGFLSALDLPLFDSVRSPWVATPPAPVRQNPSATSCDQTDFTAGGASAVTARSYVIPGATSLPDSFGMSETIGTFASRKQADGFVDDAAGVVESCSKDDPTLEVAKTTEVTPDLGRGYVWQINLLTSSNTTLVFRVALLRVGSSVAEVTFTPSSETDVGDAGYAELAVRAADRLSQL